MITDLRSVFSKLRTGLRKKHTQNLVDAHPHQGNTFECVGASRSSSHFFTDGSFTSFKKWQFMHRARLGMVPLNAYKHGQVNSDKCRVCGHQAETLPHVINNCMTHSTLIRKRQNDIVGRIKKAAMGRWEVICEDHRLGTENLRPDLVLKKDNDILIMDITVLFENGLKAFEDARLVKEAKYTNLARELTTDGNKAKVEAIIVGSLGSWDPRNDE